MKIKIKNATVEGMTTDNKEVKPVSAEVTFGTLKEMQEAIQELITKYQEIEEKEIEKILNNKI